MRGREERGGGGREGEGEKERRREGEKERRRGNPIYMSVCIVYASQPVSTHTNTRIAFFLLLSLPFPSACASTASSAPTTTTRCCYAQGSSPTSSCSGGGVIIVKWYGMFLGPIIEGEDVETVGERGETFAGYVARGSGKCCARVYVWGGIGGLQCRSI